MTDRELLELAAKGAGFDLKPMQINNVREQGDDRFIGYMTDPEQWSRGWFNPLVDDGDALRLAMALGLVVCIMNDVGFTGVYLPAEHIGGKYDVVEHHDNDPYAATRRAIVCAAAEIGKQMGDSND